MEDPLHILIVGHNLQAKCDVANAFIKQKSGFKQFNCRQNLLVKKIVGAKSTQTVAGRQLHIVLTPNLNTPGWTHMNDGIISKYTNRVFVYVKAPGLVRVNDDESIKNIKEKFRKPNLKRYVHKEKTNG
ncbi:uncharacterized protein LOC123531858 [Mercenaria mercenaria]|uniref:uncharacterized protein LOC123531858 n=1 Tax=Mercenaria mercenaria TaxID=6596 RepID=UPI00234F0B74|nr:uncharacterized protein LOC123531858 [Mercenaria mercenaria]